MHCFNTADSIESECHSRNIYQISGVFYLVCGWLSCQKGELNFLLIGCNYNTQPMYRFQEIALGEGQSRKYILYHKKNPLLYADFITAIQRDAEFRSFFINLFAGINFRSYQWETPPVTLARQEQPFEFVVHHSPGIDLPPDPGPFMRYFEDIDADEKIAVFNNLGNDARLIAPVPLEQKVNYSHIGVFTDTAPMQQQHALWQTVGRVTEERISEQPLWLNTAGGGVAWLHVRLDSQPKYYRHRPYMAID